ncbi:radical SAM/SPASM domain-containing protein [Streptomyces sp. NPDC127037]|uniref:radical SAM/SPASM domain-containing protein n=1 Tax=Streptomyces sp. NPDC127037 TaxID=3347113 RepID=UPI003648957B
MTIAPQAPMTVPEFLELEITGRCQLACSHCYAESGPTQGHGSMTAEDWTRIITEAAAGGARIVQFIGGEPSMHPRFAELVQHALTSGLRVQVYSNLYRVRAEHWDLYGHPAVTLATSYYSTDPAEHDEITGRPGSHDSTRANILEAVRRGIPIKVGVIHMRDGQRSQEAVDEMRVLGVQRVKLDRVRGVGNAAKGGLPSTSELCGRCADGKAAILPDGSVAPCVLGRFLPAGNAKFGSLAEVFAGAEWERVAASIPRPSRAGASVDEDACMPSPGRRFTACNPDQDGSDCAPAETEACGPAYE